MSAGRVWSLAPWAGFPENTSFGPREPRGSTRQKHMGVLVLRAVAQARELRAGTGGGEASARVLVLLLLPAGVTAEGHSVFP